jgi:glycosyltransferase involved in cell wall biosynthesis
MMHGRILCNTRTLSSTLTGVQRYTRELTSRKPEYVDTIEPGNGMSGIMGHMWEQFVLPLHLHGKLLWSPANSGPLAVSSQVITVHDISPVEHPEWFSGKYAMWYKFLYSRLLPRVRHIITISEYSKDRIQQFYGISSNRITVIPNGVGRNFMGHDGDNYEEVRNAYNLGSKRYVLSVCSLEPRKNLKNLLDAWSRINSEIDDDIWLLLAGAKGSPAVFNTLDIKSVPERVQFLGHVSDAMLPSLYKHALLFIFISSYEGFGLPPLEAMASGTPLISSNTTSLPEVVGEAGLLVSPYDLDEIVDAMKKMITNGNLRNRLIDKGKQRAAGFTWDECARRTYGLLQQLS